MRGKQEWNDEIVEVKGSIPACAGEALMQLDVIALPRVYPRVCGGSVYRQA